MRKLLAVGIDNYPRDMKLTGCADDAQAFADLMKKNGDGSGNFFVKVENNVSNKADLTILIEDFFRDKAETAVFYFSGHGMINESGNYIVAPDYRKGDEGVSMDRILNIVNKSKVDNKIIILDCCHSGAFGTPANGGGSLSEISPGTVILSASNSEQSALQVDGRGVFTSLLLEALKGGAADLAGIISPGSVYAYIDRALGPFDYQRPVFKTNVSQFIQLRKVRPAIPPDDLRMLVEYFPAEDAPYDLDPSYEETNNPQTEHLVTKPYTDPDKVKIFKLLQKYQGVGLVVPVDAPYMYWAAMETKHCRLTTLGQQYWKLIKEGKFDHLI